MADDLDVAKFNGVESGSATGNGTSSADMEALKQEILREMRKELAKTKQEIIEGNNDNIIVCSDITDLKISFSAIRMELNRR